MSYKIVRNADGDAVCYGPNDDNYEPSLKAGEVLVVESDMPTMPAVIPQSVSMAQARKALVMGGITMASVDAAITAIVDDAARELAQIDWEYEIVVRRDSPLVSTLGSSLSITDTQIDDLFIAADSL